MYILTANVWEEGCYYVNDMLKDMCTLNLHVAESTVGLTERSRSFCYSATHSIPFRMYVRISKNHNSLGCEQLLGLDVNQSPDVQDAFRPIPGLISCAGATGSVGVTCHAQMAGLKYPLEPTGTHHV